MKGVPTLKYASLSLQFVCCYFFMRIFGDVTRVQIAELLVSDRITSQAFANGLPFVGRLPFSFRKVWFVAKSGALNPDLNEEMSVFHVCDRRIML